MSPRAFPGLTVLLAFVPQGALVPPPSQGIRVNGPLLRDWTDGENVAKFELASDGATAVFLADPD